MNTAKKSLGQNFLIDKNIINKIINIVTIKDKNVIEIGPGKGALTKEILKKKPKSFLLIEKDNKLSQNLKLVKIYLITSSKKDLKDRLILRNQNSEEEVEKRFNAFEEDIKHWNDYDYIIINKNLDICFKQIENIIFNHKKEISFFK